MRYRSRFAFDGKLPESFLYPATVSSQRASTVRDQRSLSAQVMTQRTCDKAAMQGWGSPDAHVFETGLQHRPVEGDGGSAPVHRLNW